jgi:SAM-dependent MidA family methyltransferase
MTIAHKLLVDRIRNEGAVTFADYMALALYHPEHGYYRQPQAHVGWNGHFLTSPEIDPAFGELWARAFEQVWRECGSPESFDVVEPGPGEAGFAAAVLSAVPVAVTAWGPASSVWAAQWPSPLKPPWGLPSLPTRPPRSTTWP